MTASREAPIEEESIVQPVLAKSFVSESAELTPSPLSNSITNESLKLSSSGLLPAETLPESESFLLDFKANFPPVENKTMSSLTLTELLPKTTFHQVYRAVEKTNNELRNYYFKRNLPSSKAQASYISELEAVCAAYYKFLAPGHSANTYAMVDHKNIYQGVASEEIPGFKSIAQDPLTEADIAVSYIAEKNQFSLFDNFDDDVRRYEKKLETIPGQLKLQDKYEMEYRKKLNDAAINAPAMIAGEIDTLMTKMLTCMTSKNNITQEQGEYTKNLTGVYQKYASEYRITQEQLEKYRIVKGLAIGLTTSYILMEDDLHRNNLSKYGKRIDFDMSLWPLLYDFKDNGYVDLAFRKPGEGAFKVTLQDIHRFPNLVDAKPFYWPTNATSIVEHTTTLFKKMVSMSNNAYPADINKLFQKLEHNPVFVYHKNVILLKFILPNPAIFKTLAAMHLRKDGNFLGKCLVDKISSILSERVQAFKDQLTNSEEFADFIHQHGANVYQQIMIEFEQRNLFYQKKLLQVQTELKDLTHDFGVYQESNKALKLMLDDLEEIIVASVKTRESNVSHSQLDVKTRASKHKLDEKNEKQKMFDDNEKTLKKIKSQIEKCEAAKVAYSQQEIDLKYVKKSFENLCEELEKRFKTASSTRAVSIENKPNAIKLQKLHQTQRNAVELMFQHLQRGKSHNNLYLDYNKVKGKLIAVMESYINPGIWSLGGLFRHKIDLANELINYANSLKPDEEDTISQLKAIAELKLRLETTLATLDAGEMHEKISQLLKDKMWQLPGTENLRSPSLNGVRVSH